MYTLHFLPLSFLFIISKIQYAQSTKLLYIPKPTTLWVQTHGSWFAKAYFPVSGMEETENKTNNKLKFQVL